MSKIIQIVLIYTMLLNTFSATSKPNNLLRQIDSSNLQKTKKFTLSPQFINPKNLSTNDFTQRSFFIGNSVLYNINKHLQLGIHTRFHYGYANLLVPIGDNEKYIRRFSIKMSPEIRYIPLNSKISPFISVRYPSYLVKFDWRSQTKPVTYSSSSGEFVDKFKSINYSLGLTSNLNTDVNYFIIFNIENTKLFKINKEETNFGIGINIRVF